MFHFHQIFGPTSAKVAKKEADDIATSANDKDKENEQGDPNSQEIVSEYQIVID